MDYYIFQLINSLAGHYKWLDDVGVFFAAYSQYFLGVGVIAFMMARRDIAVFWKNFKITALAFGAAIISRFVFCQILKVAVGRPRPAISHEVTQLIVPDSFGSFPSGHMAFFFALSTVIYFYNKKAGIACYAVSLLMGLARIYVGIHYPLDILGGMVLGILVGWGSWLLFGKKLLSKF